MVSPRRARVVIAVVLVAAGVSCSAPRAAPKASPDRRDLHDVALFYSPVELAGLGVPIPSPLVKGSIGGHPTTMLVDTGAHMPVVAAWLAEEARLSAGTPVAGRDAAGRSVPMRRADHVPWTIDGWGLVREGPVAIGDLPAAFRDAGIGAIVSPQALVGDDVVVLDLVASRLRLAPRASAARRRGTALRDAGQCTYDADGVTGRSLVATATVDGTDVLLELDTGTNGITLGRETDVGERIARRPKIDKARGLGAGGEFVSTRAADVPVRFGGVETSISVALVTGAANPACRTAGRVGMDFLRGCVVEIGADTLAVSCEPPPISTGDARCDACVEDRCREPSAVCRRYPARCNAFVACGRRCRDRACIEECAKSSPEGMAFHRCANERCREACP